MNLEERVELLEKKIEWMHRQLDVCEMGWKNIVGKANQRDERRENLSKRIKALEEAFKYAEAK